MAFIQIIECESSKVDDLRRINEEWEHATAGRSTARRIMLCRHRKRPERIYEVVFFDSYEAAMENSDLEETQDFAKQLSDVLDGEPTFHDLDVIEDRSL